MITLSGHVFQPYSISTVARELALSCYYNGMDISIDPGSFSGKELDDLRSALPTESKIIEEIISKKNNYGYNIVFPTQQEAIDNNKQNILYMLTCPQTKTSILKNKFIDGHWIWSNSDTVMRGLELSNNYSFRSHFPNAMVLPHGINPSIYSPDGHICNIKSRNKFRFLFVGYPRLHSKGINILLEAFSKEFGRTEEASLIIKVPHVTRELEDAIRLTRYNYPKSDIITIEGDSYRLELASVYRSADALVHPTRIESFGMSVLEAAACGLPIITSALGGQTEFLGPSSYLVDVIADDARLGMWFDPHIDSLRRQMRNCYEDGVIARELAYNYSKVVRSKWSWNAIVRQLRSNLQDK